MNWNFDDLIGHLDAAYARQVMKTLVNMGPHIVPGTDRDHHAAKWIAAEMERVGLSRVRLEPFPVLASDIAAGGTFTLLEPATFSIEGVPPADSWPTPSDGVEGTVVYVGSGTPDEITQDLKGKIVLFRRRWPSVGCHGTPTSALVAEAWRQGAAAIMSFDEFAPPDAVRLTNLRLSGSDIRMPFLFIAPRDAHSLIDILKSGTTVRASFTSRKQKPQDGVSYNVVGEITGRRRPDQIVQMASHYDTWFYGAVDTLGGIGCVLGVAKAMVETEFQPDRTILFVAHGAEESGMAAWNDWLVGAYYLVQVNHPEWAGKMVAQLNIDGVCQHAKYQWAETAPELTKVVKATAHAAGIGTSRIIAAPSPSVWFTGMDVGAYVMAGVPGATISNALPEYWDYYHTAYDNEQMVSESCLDWTMKLWGGSLATLSTAPAIPLSVSDALDGLLKSLEVDARHLASAGLSIVGVNETASEASRSLGLARLLESLLQSILSAPNMESHVEVVDRWNEAVLECLREVNAELRVIGDPFYPTMFYLPNPHARDAGFISAALQALRSGDLQKAAHELSQTCHMRNLGKMTREAHEIIVGLAGRDNGAWARKRAAASDVFSEWSAILELSKPGYEPDVTTVKDSLETKLGAAIGALASALTETNERLRTCTEILAKVASEVEEITPRPSGAEPGQPDADLSGAPGWRSADAKDQRA